MYSKPGTPCNDYNGYCDVFQRCREVDPSGPLATLRKLLLSEESIASFKKWVISNWYAVSLIIVAVFALLVSRFKLFFSLPPCPVAATLVECETFFIVNEKKYHTCKIAHMQLYRFLKKWDDGSGNSESCVRLDNDDEVGKKSEF